MEENKNFWQMAKFTLFSVSAGIVQVVSFAILELFFKEVYWVPYLLALIISILWNFTLNRRYTFQSAANVPIAMLKVFGFYLVFTPVSTLLGEMASKSGGNEYIILAVTMISNFALEYLFCKFVVYRNQEYTRKKKTN